MDRTKAKRPLSGIMVAAVAVALLVCTAVAAVRYLSPAQVAQEAGNASVAQAFESPGAVLINESQTCGDYTVTVLGMVSGENLNESMSNGTLNEDRSYLAVALARTDGTPLEAVGESALAFSPLISGYAPWQVNAYSLFGGCGAFLEDGVEYVLLDCDTLEVFADHTVYLAVYEGMVPDSGTFTMDEETGEIAFADGYNGAQALFVLPLDSSKADSAAAAEILAKAGLA